MKTWIPDSRNFAYLNWKQVDALPRESTLLVLPTAAIEQHGPHLPLATDTLINNLLLGHALEKLPPELSVYALPPVHYGKSNEHIGFPGTLSVSASTFMAVLRDLGASISSAGFKKLVLYNTHGGNTSLIDVMARDLRAEFGLRTFALHGSGGIAFEGSIRKSEPTASTPAKLKPLFFWRACRNSSIARPTRPITSRTSRNPTAAPGKRAGHFCLAHARYCAQRRHGRPASSDGGKRRAVDRRSRDAAGDIARSDVPLSGSARKMNPAVRSIAATGCASNAAFAAACPMEWNSSPITITRRGPAPIRHS